MHTLFSLKAKAMRTLELHQSIASIQSCLLSNAVSKIKVIYPMDVISFCSPLRCTTALR